MKLYFIVFIAILSSHPVLSQQFNFEGSFNSKAIASNKQEIPFWLHTNSDYTLSTLTNASITADLSATLSFSTFKLNAGAAVYARDGVPNSVQRRDLYLQFENSWLLATLGAKKREEVLDGLSSSSQNFLWSHNARPIPGLLLEANNPFKILKIFSIDWGIAHYELNDNRFVDGTHLHYKRLAIITTLNESNKITAKVQHFAQWGGTSPDYGKLSSDFRDFMDVFFTLSPSNGKIDGEILNKLGNHLGSYFLEYEFKNKLGTFSIYHEHPFEDGSGSGFRNFPDGISGLHFKPHNQNLISAVLYEYTNTIDQSGRFGVSGRDNYFSNGIYESGWTYENNIIGTPFVLYGDPESVAGNDKRMISNRSIAHHFGATGNINRFNWKIKSTYTTYLGTYSRPLTPKWKYWYNYASLSYKAKNIGTLTILGGLDFSNISTTTLGGGVEYTYTF
ncbi:capsule assembly Wzi family protein [Xanthomarina gelatinilytica]|uniref:capsule assembly Wzi family protein n=1 Tax=Xanthomarina gelatinilytica TaxID=1137281 RepID=UPI003AA9D4B3